MRRFRAEPWATAIRSADNFRRSAHYSGLPGKSPRQEVDTRAFPDHPRLICRDTMRSRQEHCVKENVRKIIAELNARGIQLPDGDIRLGGFGDSAALSNSLIDLIVAGAKRATSSLLWSWHFDNETPPRTGDVEIVLDWQGAPALIRRTTQVDITPFDCVAADFAAGEGEGDLSLAYWRNEHWRFFSEECRRIGRVAEKTMPVVCERFEVLRALTPTQ
ncbi:MAG: ASCH domain-containing protein [Paraburkholderia tropica]|uniref:ASCH domain-containing protein n=1 Tax=Paraburkholderia tropica TaxID=92647 RepID=UPI0017E24E43|nr:ASCH domain-containing protein [Paraburkholderia tropica]MBB3003602.1 uncharacterized protein YhfF [Paraburkholderia tropica]MBB6322489.1 uncharacterized protein YhfF [Paraburkholderia tropica]MDE1143980.1 ASCH domain-containing protein [Paraburkholderia tropica]